MNYTIYIASDLDKNDRFYGEENKSGLVNELLRRHYGISSVNIKQNRDGTISPQRVGQPVSVEVPEVIKPGTQEWVVKTVNEIINVKPCKHGADPKFCKFSSPGKACK